MYRSQSVRFLSILLLGLLLGGCAAFYGTEQNQEYEEKDKRYTIAVLPFSSVAEVRGSGLIVADTLANQIYALGHYAVLTPEHVVARLADHEGEALAPGEAARIVGASYLVSGRVTEYTYKAGVGETPVLGVTIRLIDAASNAVLWSATRVAIGSGNWFREDSISRLTLIVCEELAELLDEYLDKRFGAPDATGLSPVGAPATQVPQVPAPATQAPTAPASAAKVAAPAAPAGQPG